MEANIGGFSHFRTPGKCDVFQKERRKQFCKKTQGQKSVIMKEKKKTEKSRRPSWKRGGKRKFASGRKNIGASSD